MALDQWHSVVVGREGAIGWLRLDNDTPVTGHSQVRTIHSAATGKYTSYNVITLCAARPCPGVYLLISDPTGRLQ